MAFNQINCSEARINVFGSGPAHGRYPDKSREIEAVKVKVHKTPQVNLHASIETAQAKAALRLNAHWLEGRRMLPCMVDLGSLHVVWVQSGRKVFGGLFI